MKLSENPQVKVALDQTSQVVEARAKQGTLTDIRGFLAAPEMVSLLEQLLEFSTLKQPQKEFLHALLIEKKSKHKAMVKAFGKDLGYAEGEIYKALMKQDVVKEFIDMIKAIYLRFVPVASLKEFEMILNPMTKDKDKLEAIKDVKATAGIGLEKSKGSDLPVHITLNFNKNEPQPIKGEEIQDGQQ